MSQSRDYHRSQLRGYSNRAFRALMRKEAREIALETLMATLKPDDFVGFHAHPFTEVEAKAAFDRDHMCHFSSARKVP